MHRSARLSLLLLASCVAPPSPSLPPLAPPPSAASALTASAAPAPTPTALATATATAATPTVAPATPPLPAKLGPFDATISVRDGGRGRESVVRLDDAPVQSLGELTRTLARKVAKRGKLHVLFVNDSYGVAPEDVEATRKAVEKAGISDITFGVIPLEPP